MKDISILPETSIKEAMEKLDRTAEKTLLVVDKGKKILGTLSDGDIRRHILKTQNLKSTIEEAFNRNPIYIFEETADQKFIKERFLTEKISVIPLVDENKVLTRFLTWSDVFGQDQKQKNKELNAPVVIMAGGRGTRLEPFTKVLPKPLVPIGDKPVIDHIIDRFKESGIERFYVTIHHLSKIMRAYFDEKKLDYSITFAEEEIPCGTAGSLKLLTDRLDEPFFVSNCDIIIDADYSSIYSFHVSNSHDITLVASTKQFNIPYGVCELNNEGKLSSINEKPEFSYLVNTGLYILNPNVIDFIPEKTFFHITQLMEKVKENGGSIGVFPVSEKAWIDVGQWAEYRKALNQIEGI